MEQASGRWLCVSELRVTLWVTLWVTLCAAAPAAAADGASLKRVHFPEDILTLLATLRPTKSVLRGVKYISPEHFWDLDKRLEKWGYPFEAHSVRTEDGYLLTLHRIPRSSPHEEPSDGNDTKPPILLIPGLAACSESWVLGGPGIAPALILADRGYDVWLINLRGSHYSNKHETLRRRDQKFWMFSLHEMGKYDLPNAIDYVLNTTKHEKLFVMGLSMGNTVFYVAMSLRPEYNDKIKLHLSLAPFVFSDDSKSAFQVAITNDYFFKSAIDASSNYEIFPKSSKNIALSYLLCSEKAYFNTVCAVLLSSCFGPMDLNKTANVSMLLARLTSSTSALVCWHVAQIARSGEFRDLDYGAEENRRLYGGSAAPEYPLEKVTAPVGIYAAEGDFVVSIKAAEHLATKLPNVVFLKTIRETFFNHVDFIFHQNLYNVYLSHVLEVMHCF